LKPEFILIDFENVQPANLGALSGQPVRIKILLGKNQARIPVEVAEAMQILSKDRGKAARFYQEVFGFSVTDYIAWDELDPIFVYCNPRHHSLAPINEC